MTTEKNAMPAFSCRVYGLGVMAVALLCLVWGEFDPGQPVPKNFPGRAVLAYAAGAFMLVAGAATTWRRTAAWGAAALTAYFALVVVLLMNGRVWLAHYADYLTYESGAMQVALAAGGGVIFATNTTGGAGLARRPTR